MRLRRWLWGMIICGLVAVVYWPTWNNGLVSDDMFYVGASRELSSVAGLRDIWFKLGATVQYYPLVHSTLWVEYQLWGLDPRGYHTVNAVLHAIGALLLWRLLDRLEVRGGWLAAAIFAVHPVYVESVAWASERKNVLAGMLVLASMLCYLRFCPASAEPVGERESRATGARAVYYALALLLYLGALLSKTVVASMPAVLLVVFWWKRGRITGRDAARLAPFFAVGLALSCVTVWMEKTNVGARGSHWELSPVERLLIAGRAVWFYAGELAWPYPLAFTYPRWRIDSHAEGQWLFPLAAAAVVCALWLARGRIGRGPLAAVLIFIGVLVPALGFFDVYPFLFSFVADHYQYHASMALVALAAAGVVLASERAGRWAAWTAGLAAVAILLPLAALAHEKTYAYRDSETLTRDNIALVPQAWAAQYRFAVILTNEHKYAEALAHYEEALRLYPEHAMLNDDIGTALVSLGRVDEGVRAFRRALAGELPGDDRRAVYYHLGNALASQKRNDEAIESFQHAIKLDPQAAGAMYSCAVVMDWQGDTQSALEMMRRSVKIQPGFAPAQHALATMLLESGQPAEALEPLTAAARLAPNNPLYHLDLAGALLRSGKMAAAESHLRRVIELDPRAAAAHNLLGIVLAERGDFDAGIAEFRAALAIDPKHAGAQENLQKALEARRGSK
jgi:protein O-mannosyl-transferase